MGDSASTDTFPALPADVAETRRASGITISPEAALHRALQERTDELEQVRADYSELRQVKDAIEDAYDRVVNERDLYRAEAATDGPAYNAGRSEGHADVAAELRSILDPEDAHHWNLTGLLAHVRGLTQSLEIACALGSVTAEDIAREKIQRESSPPRRRTWLYPAHPRPAPRTLCACPAPRARRRIGGSGYRVRRQDRSLVLKGEVTMKFSIQVQVTERERDVLVEARSDGASAGHSVKRGSAAFLKHHHVGRAASLLREAIQQAVRHCAEGVIQDEKENIERLGERIDGEAAIAQGFDAFFGERK